MIKCLTCGTSNLESSQYCDECGTSLANATTSNVTENSKNQKSSATSIGIPLIIEEHGSGKDISVINNEESKQTKAKLIIERGNAVGTEFNVKNDESYIGRWDADNGIFPDIDLDVHDPEAKVSRRHARIFNERGTYQIEDLGSTNGTFVNRGRRLIPGNPHLLSDGDEIIVGKTFLRFQIA